MHILNYIAIIASLLTIISVCINIIQWRSKRNLTVTLKSRGQASYNYFYQIATHADRIRSQKTNDIDPAQVIATAIQNAHSINGLSDAARYDIISYSREHLNFIPVKEHPATPFPEALPKPIKKRKTEHNNANSADAKHRVAD